jgi:hypothetical protein
MDVRWLVRVFLLGCLTVGSLAACEDGGGRGPATYVGQESSALIQASQGGEVSVGAVKVTVPAEALEKDTRLSAKVSNKREHPDKDRIAIDVYEFGPEGTIFTKDVELKFDLKGVKVGKSQRARVAELDGETNAWKALPDSKVVDGHAVATTKHFSLYTVLLEPSEGTFEPVVCDADFSPCGGDLTGAWEFTKGCVTGFSQGTPMPVLSGSACDEAVSLLDVGVSGSAHFGIEQDTNIDQVVVVTSSFSIPLACLAEMSGAGGTPLTCDTFGGVIEGRNCTQSNSSGDIPTMVEGTYTSEGGTLTIDASDGFVLLGLGTLNPQIDYCVRGDTLTLRLRDATAAGEPQVYEARRASGS